MRLAHPARPFLALLVLLLAPSSCAALARRDAIDLDVSAWTVDEINELASEYLYVEWDKPELKYAGSIRPTLAHPRYSKLLDDGFCYYNTSFNSRVCEVRGGFPPPDPAFVTMKPVQILEFNEIGEFFIAEVMTVTAWEDWRLKFNPSHSFAGGALRDHRNLSHHCTRTRGFDTPEPSGSYFLLRNTTSASIHPRQIFRPDVFKDGINLLAPPEVVSSETYVCDAAAYTFEHFILKYKAYMDRSNFPFDRHVFAMPFVMFDYRPFEVELRVTLQFLAPGDIPTAESFLTPWNAPVRVPGWTASDVNLSTRYVFLPRQDSGSKYSVPQGDMIAGLFSKRALDNWFASVSLEEYMFHVNRDTGPYSVPVAAFLMSREPHYVYLTQVFPLVIVTLMGGGQFFVSINYIGVRLTVSITALLTVVALTSFIMTQIPQISELTWMHILLICSYSYLCLLIFEILAISTALSAEFARITKDYERHVARNEVLGLLQNDRRRLHAKMASKPPLHKNSGSSGLFIDEETEERKTLMCIPLFEWTTDDVVRFFALEGHLDCCDQVKHYHLTGFAMSKIDIESLLDLGIPSRLEALRIIGKLAEHNKFRRLRNQRHANAAQKGDTLFRQSIRLLSNGWKQFVVHADCHLAWLYPISFLLVVVISGAVYSAKGGSGTLENMAYSM